MSGVFLNPADSANGDAYTEVGDDGQIRVELTDLNPQATTTVDDVFTISSTNDRSRVWIEHDGDESVTFYRMDTRESIGSESDRLTLDRNESVAVGIEVETDQSEVVLSQITVHAGIQPTATPPTAEPPSGTQTPTDTPPSTTATATPEPEPPTPTDTPRPSTPTDTDDPSTPTDTDELDTTTATPEPSTPTPEPSTPTDTDEPPAPTDADTPTDESTTTDAPTGTDTPETATPTESSTDEPTTVDAGITPGGGTESTPTVTPTSTASPPSPATTAPPQGENVTEPDGVTVSTPDDTEIGGLSPVQLGGVVAALAALGAGLLAWRALGSTASLTLSADTDSGLAVAPGELAAEWYDPVDGGFEFRFAESDPWVEAAGDGAVSFESALSVTNTSSEPTLVDVDPGSVPDGATLSADGVDLTDGPVRLEPGNALDVDIDLDPTFDPDGDVDILFRRTPVE